MKTIRLFPLELGRLLRSRLTWLVDSADRRSPPRRVSSSTSPPTADTMLSMYLANPALAGGVAGGILFALLTIFELDRTGRSRVDVLMDAAVSPHTMALVRLLALLAGGGAGHWPSPCWCGSPSAWGSSAPSLTGTDYVLAYLLFHGAGPAAVHSGRRLRLSVSPGGRTCPWCCLPPSPV